MYLNMSDVSDEFFPNVTTALKKMSVRIIIEGIGYFVYFFSTFLTYHIIKVLTSIWIYSTQHF